MARSGFGRFKPDRAGIQAVFKGPAMQAELASLADGKASEAESLGHLHGTGRRPGYEGVVKVLDRTAVAVVRPADVLGRIDEKYHHTLDSINH